jgi:hypothetical protein
MRNTKLLVGALALAAVGGGIAGCAPSATASAGGAPVHSGTAMPTSTAPGAQASSGSVAASGSVTGTSTGPGRYILQSMPAGTVFIEPGTHGHLRVRVGVFGLTPGSSHEVSIQGPLGHPVSFPALTADAAGQADTTLTSVGSAGHLPLLSRFVIRLGDSAGDPLAGELIAETGVLPVHPVPGSAFAFHAVTFGTNGVSLGRPSGQTTLSYNAPARTLTVTVTASGLTPGPHAAHIHLGSCLNQGPVKYMMADFVADANGNIIDQARVITGVTGVPAPGNWYLNLHQGGMNQILADGVPTRYFRPMLCTDLTTFAGTGTASPSASPTSPAPAGTPSTTMPTATPSMTMPAGTPSTSAMPAGTPSPSSSPSITINAQPTHY